MRKIGTVILTKRTFCLTERTVPLTHDTIVNRNFIMLTNMPFSKPVVTGFEEHYYGVYKVSAVWGLMAMVRFSERWPSASFMGEAMQ